jgi:hypothetical protein
MSLTQQSIHLSTYHYSAPVVATADDEITAMLQEEDLNVQISWFLLLARKYTKDVNPTAHARLHSIYRERRHIWAS